MILHARLSVLALGLVIATSAGANEPRTAPATSTTSTTSATSTAGAESDRAMDTLETVETATFSMFCYWTGEATLGQVDGVVASRIGHWSGNEIVQVDYDPRRTNLDALTRALKARDSLYFVVAEKDATASDALTQLSKRQLRRLAGRPHFIAPKHSLRTRHPAIWALDLNEKQAIELNSWSYFGGPMPDVLTREQKARLHAAQP